jgi:hypothetical protein
MYTFVSVCVQVATPPAAVKPSVAVEEPRAETRFTNLEVVADDSDDDRVNRLVAASYVSVTVMGAD